MKALRSLLGMLAGEVVAAILGIGYLLGGAYVIVAADREAWWYGLALVAVWGLPFLMLGGLLWFIVGDIRRRRAERADDDAP